jgi:hypothetical protein
MKNLTWASINIVATIVGVFSGAALEGRPNGISSGNLGLQ